MLNHYISRRVCGLVQWISRCGEILGIILPCIKSIYARWFGGGDGMCRGARKEGGYPFWELNYWRGGKEYHISYLLVVGCGICGECGCGKIYI